MARDEVTFSNCILRISVFCGFLGVSAVIYVVVGTLTDHLIEPGKNFFEGVRFYFFVAGLSATMATLSGVRTISAHMRYNRNPRLKWCIVRILMLVPVYSIDAYFCLKYSRSQHKWAYILTAFREVYEAVVLVSFVQFVVAFLGDGGRSEQSGPHVLAVKLSAERTEHLPIARLILPRMAPGSDFVSKSLFGILQYAFVMLLVVVLDSGIWIWQLNDSSPASVHLQHVADKIPRAIKAASNGLAMYSLVLFYHETLHAKVTREAMQNIQPYNKFVCIKGIVLLTFWQTGLCEFLVGAGYMWGCDETEIGSCKGDDYFTKEQMGNAILNFVLCIEMLGFAQWHRMAFPVCELVEEGDETQDQSCWDEIWSTICLITPTSVALPTAEVLRDPDRFLRVGNMFKQIVALRKKAFAQRVALTELRAAQKSNNAKAIPELIEQCFNEFDVNENNTVFCEQVKFVLVFCEGISYDQASSMVEDADEDRDGCLNKKEFQLIQTKEPRESLTAPLL
jgi:hypothetical protein